MTVLVTGFEGFEGDSYNVSGAIAKRLHSTHMAQHRIIGATLPVIRYDCINRLKQLIDTYTPAVIISLGYARVASSLRLERTAINMDDFRIADNQGNQPIDERIFTDAPDAIFSTLPIKRATHAIRNMGIAAHINESAGTYLCNHIFFGGLYHTKNTPIKCGFVHVPPDEKLAGTDTGSPIPLLKQCDAICTLIKISLTTQGDDKISGLGKGWD